MTDLLEKALATARTLPPELQDEIARVVLALAGDDDGQVYHFDSEEAAELDESETAARHGEFATDQEVRAIWAKHGL